MIEEPDIDQVQGGLQPLRDAFIGLAGFGDARRVIVGKNDRRGIDGQGFLDDLPRVNGCPVYRAPEQLFETEDPMPVVQIKTAEQLVAEMSQTGLQESLGICRAANRLSNGQRLREVAAREFRKRAQDAQPCVADAIARQDVRRVGVKHGTQAAETVQKLSRRVGRGRGAAGTDQGGEQFTVGLLSAEPLLHDVMVGAWGISLQRIILAGIAGFGRIT